MTDFDAASTWNWRSAKTGAFGVALLALALGGCETAGNILGGPTLAPEPVAAVPTPPPRPQLAARFALAPIIGAPDALSQQLRSQLVQSAERQRIGILADRDPAAEYGMRGYVVAARDKGGVKVSYIWDVTDTSGKRVNRITGEEVASATPNAKDPWGSVTPQLTQTIADKVAASLGAWAPSQPKPAGGQAPVAATAPAAHVAGGPPPSSAGIAVGSTTPAPIMQAPAGSTLPPTAVTGAPGDGNEALAAALQRELGNSGVPLGSSQGYRVDGTVTVGAIKDGKQPIQIDWRVKDGKGAAVGTVTQKNAIPPGSLDGSWGKTADAAAAAAAQGIIKLLPQQAAARQTN